MRDEETEERVDHFALSFGTLIDWAQEHGYPPSACDALRSALAAVREAEGERLTAEDADLLLQTINGEEWDEDDPREEPFHKAMSALRSIAAREVEDR